MIIHYTDHSARTPGKVAINIYKKVVAYQGRVRPTKPPTKKPLKKPVV